MKRILILSGLALAFPAWCAAAPAAKDGVRFDFNKREEFAKAWQFYTHNPLLPKTTFRIERRPTAEDGFVLVVNAASSSGFICTAPKFDLNKYPIMRWRWRIIRNLNLSENVTDPDDQAAVVYIGDNRHISHRFVQLGLTRPQAVLLVCLLCLIQGAGATTLLWLPAYGFFLILLQTIALFSLVSIIQFCHKTE